MLRNDAFAQHSDVLSFGQGVVRESSISNYAVQLKQTSQSAHDHIGQRFAIFVCSNG